MKGISRIASPPPFLLWSRIKMGQKRSSSTSLFQGEKNSPSRQMRQRRATNREILNGNISKTIEIRYFDSLNTQMQSGFRFDPNLGPKLDFRSFWGASFNLPRKLNKVSAWSSFSWVAEFENIIKILISPRFEPWYPNLIPSNRPTGLRWKLYNRTEKRYLGTRFLKFSYILTLIRAPHSRFDSFKIQLRFGHHDPNLILSKFDSDSGAAIQLRLLQMGKTDNRTKYHDFFGCPVRSFFSSKKKKIVSFLIEKNFIIFLFFLRGKQIIPFLDVWVRPFFLYHPFHFLNKKNMILLLQDCSIFLLLLPFRKKKNKKKSHVLFGEKRFVSVFEKRKENRIFFSSLEKNFSFCLQ